MDDRFLFENAVAQILPKGNYTLKFAGNGAEVLAVLQDILLPDILFLDLNMPRQDGLSCLARIRALPRFDQLPIVILSTSTNMHHIHQAMELGADLYAVKPMKFDVLVNVVAICLKKTANAPLIRPQKEFLIKLN